MDFLTDRKAKINIEELKLKTPFTSINIITEINRSTDELFIQPQSKAIIKLPVDPSEGDFLCNSLEIDNILSVSGGLYTASDGHSLLEITNSSETGQILCLDQPLNVEPYNKECYDQINGVTLNPSYQQIRRNLNEHISTDHLNDEEKQGLLKICKKFQDLFYDDATPLTFSNTVKHPISTTDNIPVHVKTYRYPYIHKEEVHKQI